MAIQRNGNKFYRGTIDICEMLEYHRTDTFASIKIDGAQLMCPVQAVIFVETDLLTFVFI